MNESRGLIKKKRLFCEGPYYYFIIKKKTNKKQTNKQNLKMWWMSIILKTPQLTVEILEV